MKLLTLSFLLTFALSNTLVFSQTNNQTENDATGESRGLVGFWEVQTSTGNFVARLDHISSVSQHQYYIDGAVKVYECTVATSGGMTARFYYLEPVGANSALSTSNTMNNLKNLANKATSRAGMGDAEHIVTKHYPQTTHAKTAEYRFKNKDTISRIYTHARRVWAEQRGQGKANKITIIE